MQKIAPDLHTIFIGPVVLFSQYFKYNLSLNKWIWAFGDLSYKISKSPIKITKIAETILNILGPYILKLVVSFPTFYCGIAYIHYFIYSW